MILKTLFDEYFAILGMDENEIKLFYLIDRYEDKVSERLKNIRKDLYKKGRENAKETISSMIYKENPFLNLMSKEDSYSNLYHQPVILGLEHGVTFKKKDD